MLARIIVLAALLLTSPAYAQPYKPPRNGLGQPDLEGLWTTSTLTRLQRGPGFKGLVATPEEAAAAEKRHKDRQAQLASDRDPNAPAPPAGGDVGDLESEWFEADYGLTRIRGELRSSLVVDPPDGKIPWSEAGLKVIAAAAEADEKDFRGPEARSPDERCLSGVGGPAGPPMLGGGYNSHVQIVQSATAIALVVEMNHDVRIVRLGDRRHVPPSIRTFTGDSVGWWEGDTLVVETVGQHPASAWRWRPDGILWISPAARVTERFTRISPTEILYAFSVEDPAVLTRPWRAETVMRSARGPMYEYACHEGNYSLPNILAGARAQEREAARAQPVSR